MFSHEAPCRATAIIDRGWPRRLAITVHRLTRQDLVFGARPGMPESHL
jgi:hypothetical protein